MLQYLIHVFNNAETYTVLLTWITLPLGFYASYYFCKRHYGMFVERAEVQIQEPGAFAIAQGEKTEEGKS